MLSRRKLFVLFRGFVSVGLLFYLFTMIDWNRFVVLFGQIEKRSLLLAPILLMLGLLFAAIRWHHLLASLRIHQKIRKLYAYYLMGSFYSIFLPGVIGGDIVRIGICAKETKSSVGVITTSVLIERVCGVIILFIMGSLVVFTLPLEFGSALGEPMIKALPAVTTLCLLLLVAVFIIGRRFRDRWFDEKKRSGLMKQLLHILDLAIRLPYSTFLILILFSALLQSADILASFAIAKALKISLPLSFFFVIMPIVYISTILPVSLGGLGVREGILVYLLAKVDVLSSDAVALSFLLYFNRVAIGSIGGIAQMFWKANRLFQRIAYIDCNSESYLNPQKKKS